MPFTLAHPAAVMPLARGRLVASGLVVGSVAPDFEYFLRWSPHGVIGHTLPGVILFCLPMGLAALWAMGSLWRTAPLSLLPPRHGQALASLGRVARFESTGWILWSSVSIVLGALVHIGLDAFTHAHGFFAQRSAMLQTVVWEPWVGTVHLYDALQYGTSVAGMLLLAMWYRRWIRDTKVARVRDTRVSMPPSPPTTPSLSRSPSRAPVDLPSLPARRLVVGTMVAFAAAVAVAYAYHFVVAGPGLDRSVLWADPRAFRLFWVVCAVAGLPTLLVEITLFSLFWNGRRVATPPLPREQA